MNHKEYGELKKHLSLEHELEEKEKVVDAFRRVKKGERFSFNDLEVVRKELFRQQGDYKNGGLNMNEAIYVLEKDISVSREKISNSKRRLKKRGLDLERLRRQRRLHLQREMQKEKNH